MAAAPDRDLLPTTLRPLPRADRPLPGADRPLPGSYHSVPTAHRPVATTNPRRRSGPVRRRRAVLLPLLAALGLATAAAASAQPPTEVVRPSADAGAPAVGRTAASGAGSRGAAAARVGEVPEGAAAVGPASDGPGPADPRVPAHRSPAASSYVWPTGGPADVLRAFDAPSAPWAPGHRGVDLELDLGSAVLAAADGVVVFAGTVVDRPVVSIEHADGIRTTYEPVRPSVRPGQRVAAGEAIGHLEGLHCLVLPPGGCLHLGARTGPEAYVDPLRLLRADVVVRLLPDGADAAG